MRAVGCNCGKNTAVKYEVTFADGTKQKYDSVSAAQQAGKSTNQTYTFKAVPA